MKKSGGGADTSHRPLLGKRVLWDTESPDHECDCPGPPPQFYLPPPPRPSSLMGSDCSENSLSNLETCEVLPVIDPEYHNSSPVTSLGIILTLAAVVLVFLFIGTFLVALKACAGFAKHAYAGTPEPAGLLINQDHRASQRAPNLVILWVRKKKIQRFFTRKSSGQTRCDAASTNGVIYEDLTSIRPRTLSPHCSSGQTTLPTNPIVEMMDIVSYHDDGTFSSAFICPASLLPDTFSSQELFNPVYEELSNGSGEKGETDSEGMPRAAISEDEFAEDELSLGGEPDIGLGLRSEQKNGPLKESVASNIKDVDFSDADDKCKFFKNCEKNLIPSPDRWEKDRKTSRVLFIRGTTKRLKCLDRKKLWKNKGSPSLPSSVNCNDFHESFFIKRIFQIYPDVTGVNLQHSLEPSDLPPAQNRPSGDGNYESLAAFSQTQSCRIKPKMYSSLGAIKNSVKNQNQDSFIGSDSGYSNNTTVGKFSLNVSKGYRLPNRTNSLLS